MSEANLKERQPAKTAVQADAVSVDNALSPHGGTLVDRVVTDKSRALELAAACDATITLRGQIAREIISIAYGFFSPIEGFMTEAELKSVCETMTLPSGHVWSIPLVFDLSASEIKEKGVEPGKSLLLEYHNVPMAVLHVEDVYTYDHRLMAKQVYGVEMGEHPGLQRTLRLENHMIGGKIDLINEPVFKEPFDRFFITPRDMREHMRRRRLKRVVAFHSRSVPHTGHEWLMKCAWFQHNANAVMVNCVVGEKRIGDCIDECILLGHEALQKHGYFRINTHLTTLLLWDTRYAGPKEAVMHAIVRKNMGCTGHIFGSNHASLEGTYGKWEAHGIFHRMPKLGIDPILVKEWFYCPHCGEVAYEGLCGHVESPERLGSKTVCSLLSTGVKPEEYILRNEVFDVTIDAADKYGFGDGYVTDEYLQQRKPVFMLNKLE